MRNSLPSRFTFFAFLLGLFVCSSFANATPPEPTSIGGHTNNRASLVGHIDYFEDGTGELRFEQILSEPMAFKFGGNKVPNFAYTQSTLWFRFGFQSETTDNRLILELGYPLLDDVILYQKDDQGRWEETQSGDYFPFSQRARDHRTITFELEHPGNSYQIYFLRVKTTSSLQLPLTVYTEESFAAMSSKENTLMGLFCGVILVMILFNGLLGLSIREKTYGYYVGFLSTYLLGQLFIKGDGFRLLFPDSPMIADTLLPLSLSLTFIFGTIFTREFLELKSQSRKWDRVALWLIGIQCVVFPLVFVLPYYIVIKPILVFIIFAPIIWITAATSRVIDGYSPARTYLVAWVTFLAGLVIYALKTIGLLPSNMFTENTVMLGSTLLVTLLSLALADRIKLAQAHRAASQEALLETYHQLDAELAKRTQLEEQNTHLEEEISYASTQLIQADKLSTLGSLLAGVAHDIANPTQFIQGGVEASLQSLEAVDNRLKELLDLSSQEAEKVYSAFKQDMSTIEKAQQDICLGAQRIATINSAIRNQTRRDEDLTYFNVLPLLDECITILGGKLKWVQTEINCNESLQAFAHRSHIGQVLTNLIANAADATQMDPVQNGSDKGRISITIAKTPEGVAFMVEDNGPGVAPENQKKILEPFFTTKGVGKGTGLGMPICAKIIQAHHAELHIDQSPMLQGARFSFILAECQADIDARAVECKNENS